MIRNLFPKFLVRIIGRVEAALTSSPPHRTVLALLTHTALQSRIHQDYFPLGYLYRFRFHSIITSVCVECFPGKGTALSSPSLSRHYPVFTVLRNDPTP